MTKWQPWTERLIVGAFATVAILFFVGVGIWRDGKESFELADVPLERSIPFMVGFIAGFVVFFWSPAFFSWYHNRDDGQFALVGFLCGTATTTLIITLSSLVESIMAADGLENWVSANLASGRLSFYSSSIVFSCFVFPKAFRRGEGSYFSLKDLPADGDTTAKLTSAAIMQTCLYGCGLAVLSACYSLNDKVPFVALLSWALFFVLDDWALLEHFVIFGGARLPRSQFLLITVFNAIIMFVFASLMSYQSHTYAPEHSRLSPEETANALLVFDIFWGAMAVGFLTVNSVYLYRHVNKVVEEIRR